MEGFDLAMIRDGRCVSSTCRSSPVGAPGGLDDLGDALAAGASAVAAASMFVFHGRHRAVLISYPPRTAIDVLMKAGLERQ